MVGSSNIKVLERLLDLSVFDFLRLRLMVSLSSRSCTYIDSSLKLDRAKRAVAVGDKSITLRLTPFRILELLVSNAGRVVSRQSIFSVIWGFDFDPGTEVRGLCQLPAEKPARFWRSCEYCDAAWFSFACLALPDEYCV